MKQDRHWFHPERYPYDLDTLIARNNLIDDDQVHCREGADPVCGIQGIHSDFAKKKGLGAGTSLTSSLTSSTTRQPSQCSTSPVALFG